MEGRGGRGWGTRGQDGRTHLRSRLGLHLKWRPFSPSSPAPWRAQTYYKLSYVDRRIDSPEQRICEDVPKLASGLADLTRELVAATVDAAFYAWQLK